MGEKEGRSHMVIESLGNWKGWSVQGGDNTRFVGLTL
jgi:hypothetical protein